MWWRRRRLGRAERLDLLETLSDTGCAACRAREEAVRRWLWTYENDSAGDLTVRLLMERTLGMCAAHTRRVLALGPSSSWLAKTLFADVARAARTAVAQSTPPTEPCPPCRVGADAARDLLHTLVAGLRDPAAEPDVATYFAESDGLCAEHTSIAVRQAGASAGRQLVGQLRRQLDTEAANDRTGGPLSVLTAVTGYDPDIAPVVALRREGTATVEAAEAARAHSERAYVEFIRTAWCCPLCAAADRAERWTLGADEPGPICAHHLALLAADGVTDKVSAVIADAARPWQAAVDGYLSQRRPIVALPGRRGLPRRRADCRVCAARSAAVTAEAELLARIGADPAQRHLIADAHGVCVRHGLIDGFGRILGDPWRNLLVTRLEELAGELERSRRADSWHERDVPKGAEATAWQRAPTLLDGAILGPASPG